MTQPWRSTGLGLDGDVGGPVTSVFKVENTSQVGEVRRAGESLGVALGLSETERGSLALIITEVATNLARHAQRGRVFLNCTTVPGAVGVDVTATDEGPGIANVSRAMEDGFSSAGTSGHGLGAIRRLSTSFDLFSRAGDRPGCGTILTASLLSALSRPITSAGTRFQTGAICVAYDGGRISGDAWAVRTVRDRTLVVVADGLGHGPEAAAASSEAIRVIDQAQDASPTRLMELTHAALRSTRGAALAIASVNAADGSVDFAGIGNISVALQLPDGTSRSFASFNGTVGHAIRRVQEFRYEWSAGAMLIMHSDGITSRWRMDSYPGLLRHHPQLAVGALYRDALRGRDDATVVALGEHSD